jgi:hypothetical protein
VLHRHKDQQRAVGKVLELHLLNPQHPAPHDKRYVVEVWPTDHDPVQAELLVKAHEHKYKDFYLQQKNDVTGFTFDPTTGAVDFDMTDPRNSTRAQEARLNADVIRNIERGDDDTMSGPFWKLPHSCPGCNAPVDVRNAQVQPDPICERCDQPLPKSSY